MTKTKTTVPTLTTTEEAHALLRELAETHDWVSVFWDRGWGDSGQVAEISIIVDGNGQKPKAFVTPEVYKELRDRKLIASNSLKTYKARRVHNFKAPPPPDTTDSDRRREASEQVVRRVLADMPDVPVRVEFYRGLDPDSHLPRSMHEVVSTPAYDGTFFVLVLPTPTDAAISAQEPSFLGPSIIGAATVVQFPTTDDGELDEDATAERLREVIRAKVAEIQAARNNGSEAT